jgi:hypothetical protein
MKRRNSAVAYSTRSKKQKLWEFPLPSRNICVEYIPATKTRNFILNDSLVDWLKLHDNKRTPKRNNKRTHTNMQHTECDFTRFIMKKGIDFEKKLVEYINKKILSITTVGEKITDETCNKTIELMKAGTEIIHSAPVRNKKNKTHGIIDLLVRSDILHRIVDECPLTTEEQIISSPALGHDFHYVVIDIKFSTLPLKSDGRHILNSGSYPAYKSQCLIYTDAVGIIQGYTSQYAFILGRRWKYTRKNIKYNNSSCLNKLGVIDYKKIDNSYLKRTKAALRWIRDNNKYGHQWSVIPPSRKELYPNMCYDSGKWQQRKEKIADEIGEITTLWYCGLKNRIIGMEKGIDNWRNPECTSLTIGFKKGPRASIIDKILDINRQDIDKIRPKKIKSNIFEWKNECNELFVDFETLSDIFSKMDKLPTQKNTDMIFMIGVWYKYRKKWTYKRFTCKKATYEEEFRIMNEFSIFINNQDKPKLWYWFAEQMFWIRAKKRQFDLTTDEHTKNIISNWVVNEWTDMCKLFKDEPIIIKDCFKFGLKPIAKAMNKHNLISTKLDSECVSGMTAMINAWKCYKDSPDPVNCNIMKDIAKYNKFDVSVLEDILKYLRKNHK